jgi:hypothetical protein
LVVAALQSIPKALLVLQLTMVGNRVLQQLRQTVALHLLTHWRLVVLVEMEMLVEAQLVALHLAVAAALVRRVVAATVEQA